MSMCHINFITNCGYSLPDRLHQTKMTENEQEVSIMANIFEQPSKYVQEQVNSQAGKICGGYGKKALILISASGYKESAAWWRKASPAQAAARYSIILTANAAKRKSTV